MYLDTESVSLCCEIIYQVWTISEIAKDIGRGEILKGFQSIKEWFFFIEILDVFNAAFILGMKTGGGNNNMWNFMQMKAMTIYRIDVLMGQNVTKQNSYKFIDFVKAHSIRAANLIRVIQTNDGIYYKG